MEEIISGLQKQRLELYNDVVKKQKLLQNVERIYLRHKAMFQRCVSNYERMDRKCAEVDGRAKVVTIKTRKKEIDPLKTIAGMSSTQREELIQELAMM